MTSLGSTHSTPILVSPKGFAALRRAGLDSFGGEAAHREKFIQDLVHDQPAVIPMLDIEPAYTPLISVCRELGTPAGFLDNLWITPEGGLVLGECKLVRNPQARREVVAQALDYARGVSAWKFDELERQAAKARNQPAFKLWDLVSERTELDEAQFHDAVQRRLTAGRVMVLIIGDGIREGAEALTAYLQLHAGFHAGLALVDLSIWDLGDGSLIVVPRVPMRTVLVERGVVTFDVTGALQVVAPVLPGANASSTNAHTASEAEFFEQLRSRRPELVDGLRAFSAELSSVGITPEFRKSLVLRWMPSPDFKGSAGYIDSFGSVWLADSVAAAVRFRNEAAASRYLEAVAAAVGGSVKLQTSYPTVVGPSGRTVHLSDLLPVRDKWLAAIKEYVSELSQTLKLEQEGE